MKWQQRPSTRPFAGMTGHDPDGNVFDISQKDMTNRRDVYVENTARSIRAISITSRCAPCDPI